MYEQKQQNTLLWKKKRNCVVQRSTVYSLICSETIYIIIIMKRLSVDLVPI